MLECGEGAGANIAKGGDLITKNLDEDWTGGFDIFNTNEYVQR